MPTRYIGQALEVRGDSRLVHLYHHGDLTKVHASQPAGGRATDYADYPAERTPYALRAPDRCIDQAQRLGPAVGQFITVLLRGTFPWARLRQAQKLLRLAERYGPDRINAACARALAFELLDVGRVEAIVRPPWSARPRMARAGASCRCPAALPGRPRVSPTRPSPRKILMMLDLTPDLVRRLKRLRLGGLLPTLPDRVTHARQGKLSHVEFLELLLQDEIDRRDSHGLSLRLEQAVFEETACFEQIVVSFDRARVRELFSLHWLAQQENVIFCGPVGVGKTFLACALGHRACRAGHRVRCVAVTKLLQALHQSRADNSFERELRRKLSAQQSSDFYDVLVERHRRAATIITSNRAVDEWVALFDDPILANSALDRFAHRAHQIVMKGPSLRAASAPSPPKGKRRTSESAASRR